MSTRLVNQRGQANQFNELAAAEIRRTHDIIVDSSQKFVSSFCSSVLNEGLFKEAMKLAKDAQLHRLFNLLRSEASTFVKKVDTTLYWAWVDAVGFFFDATGTSWPYMTMEGRRTNLKFSQECASEVTALLSSEN